LAAIRNQASSNLVPLRIRTHAIRPRRPHQHDYKLFGLTS